MPAGTLERRRPAPRERAEERNGAQGASTSVDGGNAQVPTRKGPAGGPPRRLNLGCGRDVRPASEGWVNLDVAALPGVDVRHDITRIPYPFPDASFDEVLASHVLEHVPPLIKGRDGLISVVEELHRILRPGGILHVKVPHYKRAAHEYFANPTHYRLISHRTFDGFLGKEGTCVTWVSRARFRQLEAKTNRRTRLFGGRVTSWHLKRYLRVANLPLVARPWELELRLVK